MLNIQPTIGNLNMADHQIIYCKSFMEWPNGNSPFQMRSPGMKLQF